MPAQAAWEDKFYNPIPLDDDVILPMPCEGAMAFRRIPIVQQSLLDDQKIILGQDSEEWGYIEQSRPAYISGSFSTKEKERYYLMAKYELSELQYQTLMTNECPKPTMKLRLPASSYSWMDAIQFSDKYNLWLRQHAAKDIPLEDGVMGFIRLPTEEEWEYAARGGAAVDTSTFRESRYPMPEGINEYEWFAGSQSSNGKLQLTGLLKPNPLGLHDMLGNVNEMMLEPFRVNKLNRLHGQAGGMVVRGGDYQTPQAQLRTSTRKELPYYQNTIQNQAKTTGIRLVLVSPALTSRDRINAIEKEWLQLGDGSEEDGSAQAVSSLNKIGSSVVDEKLKKQLKQLEQQLRSSNEAQAKARKDGIIASLQLGAFLCTKIKDDGNHLAQIKIRSKSICALNYEGSEKKCEEAKYNVELQKKLINGLMQYYSNSLIDSSETYGEKSIKKMVPILTQELKNKSDRGLQGLIPFVNMYWSHQSQYFKKPTANKKDQWLKNCMAVNE